MKVFQGESCYRTKNSVDRRALWSKNERVRKGWHTGECSQASSFLLWMGWAWSATAAIVILQFMMYWTIRSIRGCDSPRFWLSCLPNFSTVLPTDYQVACELKSPVGLYWIVVSEMFDAEEEIRHQSAAGLYRLRVLKSVTLISLNARQADFKILAFQL